MDENINKKYNKLKVIRFDHIGKYKEKYYLFKCDCGKEKIINLSNVKSGKTKSCGCNYKNSGFKKKYNKYINRKEYIIGYTTNTNKKFYIDKDDYKKIKDVSWYEASNGYVCHKDKNKKVILMHRLITECPKNKIVDHINNNKKDNRKSNLRITNYSINGLNKRKLPKGIFKIKRAKKEYYVIQLRGYRGICKTYKEAKEKRDKIIEKEYLILKKNI